MTPGAGGGLPELTAALVLVVLNAYLLTGGADFGGGVWDLLASGPRREQQRELITTAIVPLWEANHVWLVIALVMSFTAFPAVFATLGIVLHVPLSLALLGIVFRGTAFVFRKAGHQSGVSRRRWGRLFAIASTITPLLLGTAVGALSTGAVGSASAAVGRESFGAVFLAPWAAPFPLLIGVLTVCLVALLAASYLTLVAPDGPLREDFRTRALAAGAAVLVVLALTLVVGSAVPARAVPRLGPPSPLWPVVAILVAGVAGAALWRRRFGLARVAVALEASLFLWGWAASQYPYLVPPTLTIRSAAAGRPTLLTLLWILAGGAVLLVPSLLYLLRLFATPPPATAGPAS